MAVCEAMLEHVAKLLSRTRRVTFLADRGFLDRDWARKCRNLGWDYIIRIANNTYITHFIAEVNGTNIHFIRAAGQGPNPVPLLLMQGWPSSFVQMLDIIPLLTEVRDDGTPRFDVVAASLPGYPFSDFPVQSGMSFSRIADVMTELMVEQLGHDLAAWLQSRRAPPGLDQATIFFPSM